MATRATPLKIEHVNALNSIDVEFFGKDEESKRVIESWRLLQNHLYDKNYEAEDGTLNQALLIGWGKKKDELLINLLFEMAKCLDYRFDKSALEKTSYYPEGHGTLEHQGLTISAGLTKLFSGDFAIPVEIQEKGIQKKDGLKDVT